MAKSDRLKNNQANYQSKNMLYDQGNNWLEKHSGWLTLAITMIGLLVGVLTFDVKPSTGGDDSGYVLQAMDIVSKGDIPIGFRAPGYPLVLALFIWLMGSNLILLKMTSLLFFLGVIFSAYVVFRKRLQAIALYPVLLVIAIHPLLQEYAHQTYSEILFTLLIIWTIHFTIQASEKNSILVIAIAALFSMAAFYVRTVGVAAAGVIIIFLLWQRRWKQVVVFLIVCILLYSPLKIYEWISGAVPFGQTTGYFLKNYYNPTQGLETWGGYIVRFTNNIINHLNYQFPAALGLPMPQELAGADGQLIPSGAAFFGILVSIVFLLGCIIPIITKPKSMPAFLGIFVIAYVVFISLALQNSISTIRMLIPIIPYLFIGTLEGVRLIGNRWAKVKDPDAVSARAKTLTILAVIVLIIFNVVGIKRMIQDNYPILKANLAGNEFAGFTEDWSNYLRASKWITNNLTKDSAGVICRKPELFRLYAGNYNVYGAYKIDQTDPDSIVAKWKMLRMTHLLYDNFQWSSTLRRYVQPVAEKYPQMFELLHQEGTQLPSYIFRLNYAILFDSKSSKK